MTRCAWRSGLSAGRAVQRRGLQKALELALIPGHEVDLLGKGCDLPYDPVAGLP